MGVKIVDVVKRSLAHKAGIKSDYTLNKIHGTEIFDVLDYDFYATDCMLEIEYTDLKGKTHVSKIKKDEYDDIGLVFNTYLIDEQRSCRNKCIFCFIDQLPKGMRDTLYFKDDDERLSFIFGNYITLTNITDREIDRIIKMHISPINISVHTTNPELRCKMMNNRFAGQSLGYIQKLADAGIKLNCQLVLCPGINDGDELLRSLNDLSALYPQVQSIACVPVGISDHREGL
ncbi:MAG: radical SAM protein, partial [Oscillospiraceae bacterium]|nr:radical SAM protein [Oscillospiraceae bacterium]